MPIKNPQIDRTVAPTFLRWPKWLTGLLSDNVIPRASRLPRWNKACVTSPRAPDHMLQHSVFSWCGWKDRPAEEQTLCRVVKLIKAWLGCTGQLLWCKDVPPCQTHRCRVMTHCVLEFCQKPPFLSCSTQCLSFRHLLPLSPVLSLWGVSQSMLLL